MEQHGISFSIIIPLYNKEHYISETINSVLNQTYEDYEIIVVNDSSTDNSLSIVAGFYSNKLKVFTIPNGGVSKARNFGLMKANNSYVCFLDADDVWDVRYLENLVSIILQYPESGFITGAYYYCNQEINNISHIVSLKNKPDNIVLEIDFFKETINNKRIIALTSCVCIKKSIVQSLSIHFAEGVHMGEDADFWLRIALHTSSVYYNTPYLYYRGNTENGLVDTYLLSLQDTFPYWNWYNIQTDNKDKNKVTTLLIYTTAKYFYEKGEYHNVLPILRKCKGRFMLFNRLFLLLRCFKGILLH